MKLTRSKTPGAEDQESTSSSQMQYGAYNAVSLPGLCQTAFWGLVSVPGCTSNDQRLKSFETRYTPICLARPSSGILLRFKADQFCVSHTLVLQAPPLQCPQRRRRNLIHVVFS